MVIDIPVPTCHCGFEDDGAYCLITEYVEGVGMPELLESQMVLVHEEFECYLAKLKILESN